VALPDAASFWSGFTHPVLGVDHLTAMVAVGVVSARLGGWALFGIPSVFVMAMAVGGTFGLNGWVLLNAEVWIAVSLVLLGAVVAVDPARRSAMPVFAAAMAVAFVAVFGGAHGNAHGLEIPTTARPLSFAVGFLIGTALLHLVGLAFGKLPGRWPWIATPVRIAGAFAMALGGGMLMRS